MEDSEREELFLQITGEFLPALRRLCLGAERNMALAKELEQEILLNLWRALPGFRGESSLKTWMYQVAHNTAARHRKKAASGLKTTVDEERVAREASLKNTPEQDLEDERRRARMREVIDDLRPLDRQVLLLFLEDVSQKEIAEITGLTQANVSTRIHRIKEVLVRRLRT